MEIMYNKQLDKFKAVIGNKTMKEADLVFVGTYPSVAAMVEYTKTVDPTLVLQDHFLNVDPSAFTQPAVNMGIWFQIPAVPAVAKMIYFVQGDKSVKLYNLQETQTINFFPGHIEALKRSAYVKYA